MARQERLKLIGDIETSRDSKVLVYIAGDRPGLETRISSDTFPVFHKHLLKIGKQKRIDLFLYSIGGITIAGFALVNLIREFCDEFNVIIPYKSLSCATLISLGADNIIMSPMGQLGPIDPSIQHPLGPLVQIPGKQPQIAPVNVEDVNAFIDLAITEAKLKDEESMRKVFELLSEKVNPLALGAVQRIRSQISFLADNLLKTHCQDEDKRKKIVAALVRERFSHDYIIGRREAKETLKLNIQDPTPELTVKIMDLFDHYSDLLELNTAYNPETIVSKDNPKTVILTRGIIESTKITHAFTTVKEVQRVQVPNPQIPIPVTGFQERILSEGWNEEQK